MKIQTRKVNLPSLNTRASILPESINKESRTTEIVWSTGAKVFRSSFLSENYYEELSLKPEHVRLDRLNNGANLLNNHNSGNLSNVLGVVEQARIDSNKGVAKVRFSDRKDVDPIWDDVCNGILRKISVGYRVYKYEKIEDGDGTIPVYRAIDWEPHELSIVAIPADDGTTIRSNDTSNNECQIISNKQNKEDVMKLTDEKKPKDPDKSFNKAKEEERKRIAEINRTIHIAKLDPEIATRMIDDGIPVDQARKEIIDLLAKQDEKTQINNQVRSGDLDEVKTKKQAVENALLNRFNQSKYELTEPGRSYRGMSLVRLGEEFVGKNGYSGSEIASRALSTSDFPLILANVATKTLTDAYKTQPQTFLPLVRIVELPDYKQVTRLQFGDAPSLEEVKEGGEYTFGKIGEAAESYKLAKHGKMIAITEETIVNDDLDAFTRIPAMFGSSAARLESKLVWDIFLNNPFMADGLGLFDSKHGNKANPSGINENGLNLARVSIRKQKTLDKSDVLDLEPQYLIVGPDKETEAKKMLASQIRPTKSGDVNVFADSLELIVESRISGNKWFVACGPNQIDTIELGYLSGLRGPQISTKEGFEVDGIMIKCKHIVAAKAIDYRGLYYNPGT